MAEHTHTVWMVWWGGFYESPTLEDIFATEELAQEFCRSETQEWKREELRVKPHEVRTSLEDEDDEDLYGEDEDDA